MAIPLISAVIITRHRPEPLKKALASLALLSGVPLEVLVVDNSDDDATERMVREEFPSVKYLHFLHTKRVISRARNFGWKNAAAEIIAFLDDDVTVDPTWAQACLDGFSDKTVGAVGGRILDYEVEGRDFHRDAPIGKVLPNGRMTDNYECDPGKAVEIDHLRGCNMAVRRDCLEKVRGFDETWDVYAFEEFDVCLRVRKAGYKILFAPKMSLYHHLAPRQGDNRFGGKSAKRRYEYARMLTYAYAKSRHSVLWPYVFSGETGLRAFVSQPSWWAFCSVVVGGLGKVAGLWRALCRGQGDTKKQDQVLFPLFLRGLCLFTRTLPNLRGSWRLQNWLGLKGEALAKIPPVTVKLFFGCKIRLDLRDPMCRTIYITGSFQASDIMPLYPHLIQQGDCVLDIGANIGIFTLRFASLVGSCGQVHAFEASPRSVDNLRKNIELNTLSQVIFHPQAVSAVCGQIEFYDSHLDSGHSSLRSLNDATIVTVPSVSIDSLLGELPPVKLIKIDIEGGEMLAFQGMQALLERDHPFIITEIADAYLCGLGSSAKQACEFLQKKGYALYLVDWKGLHPLTSPPTERVDLLCVPHTRALPATLSVSSL